MASCVPYFSRITISLICLICLISEVLSYCNIKDYGAIGNGVNDDTAAIQAALDAAHTGAGYGVVLVPDGTFMVNVSDWNGVEVASDVVIAMSSGAIIQAFPCNLEDYAMILIGGKNVTIIGESGAQIIGERNGHLGTTGEWGMGVYLYEATDFSIEGVLIRECWGDGIYISGYSRNIVIKNIECNHNRRQGISIVFADNVLIQDSVFQNTMGTAPESGIDIEPNSGQNVTNVKISHCGFYNNSGDGVEFGSWLGTLAHVENITVECNTLHTNNLAAIEGVTSTNALIINNYMYNNPQWGLYVGEDSVNFNVTGNVIVNTSGWAALLVAGSEGVQVTNNFICGSDCAIEIYDAYYNTITNNIIYQSGSDPISEQEGSTNNTISANNINTGACDSAALVLPATCTVVEPSESSSNVGPGWSSSSQYFASKSQSSAEDSSAKDSSESEKSDSAGHESSHENSDLISDNDNSAQTLSVALLTPLLFTLFT